MSGKHSVLSDALLLTGVDLLLRGTSMLFNVWLTAKIGAAGIGLLQLVMTVGGFAMTLGSSGVRTAAMYLCAEERGKNRPGGIKRAIQLCIAASLLCSTAAMTALLFAAPFAAERFLHEPGAAACLRLLALSLPISCLGSVVSGYFVSCGKVRFLVGIETAEHFLSLGLTAALLLLHSEPSAPEACTAVLLGNAAASLPALLCLLLSLRRELRPLGRAQRGLGMLPRLKKLCIPLALNSYLRSGISALEQFLIPYGLSAGSGSREAGMAAYGTIHGMVFPILMAPSAILFALSDLLVPELARCNAAGNTLRVRHLMKKTLRLTLLYAGAAAGLTFVLAPTLGNAIYQSSEVGYYLRLFAPMIVFLYTDAIVDGMCKGLGQQVACVRYNTITSAADVVLLLVLLPGWGIRGYLVSFILTHIVNFYLSIRLLLKTAAYTPRLRFVLKTLFCILAATLAAFCVPEPIAAAAVFAAAFFALLRLSEAVDREERLWILHAVRELR